ncbi:uncharacterized protein LOC129736351 [Falco cherrug]|uniref:uncharacterized protein LOC129736351 n=1 Tax=Falco cherrug TaxID=345164 RepID=UPI0024789BE6|nr:uncharacterized protein LOC129736351 [Falco cherrug]
MMDWPEGKDLGALPKEVTPAQEAPPYKSSESKSDIGHAASVTTLAGRAGWAAPPRNEKPRRSFSSFVRPFHCVTPYSYRFSPPPLRQALPRGGRLPVPAVPRLRCRRGERLLPRRGGPGEPAAGSPLTRCGSAPEADPPRSAAPPGRDAGAGGRRGGAAGQLRRWRRRRRRRDPRARGAPQDCSFPPVFSTITLIQQRSEQAMVAFSQVFMRGKPKTPARVVSEPEFESWGSQAPDKEN